MAGEALGGSTVRRIVLGSQLRHMRESRNISREAAGYAIRSSESKISRMELGRVSFKERDVIDLLSLYGVDNQQERDSVLEMVRSANEPGWWHDHGEHMPAWMHHLVGLEESASRVQTYEVRMIPGLLQTEEYAYRTLEQALPDAPCEDIQQRVNLRMNRQLILHNSRPVTVWAVVDEAALHRCVGGRDVMRRQLEHVIEATELPNLSLQVVPFSVGNYAAENAFTLLRFAEPELPDIVYVEYLSGALYLDKRSDVELHAKVANRLAVEAESPEMSRDRLAKLIKSF